MDEARHSSGSTTYSPDLGFRRCVGKERVTRGRPSLGAPFRGMTDNVAENEFLTAAILEGFHIYPVSTRVNSPKNDDAECAAVTR